MFAWIVRHTSIYMFVAGAIFLEIATDASPTGFPYKVCPGRQKEVGTRLNKKKGKYYCLGCDELRNCTSVFGSVHLKGITFNDRNKHLREELRFPELREITGHLIVTFVNGDTSLSDIFPNLAVIHGRVDSLFEGYSLVVYQNKGLRNLGLNSLTVIKQGGIKIEFNEKLCYLDQIRWQSLRNYGGAKKYELSLKRNSKDCFAQCSSICHTPSGHGSSGHKYCWGRDTKQCQKFCISKCGSSGCEDGSQEKCCDKECLGGCTRAFSADHCHACQHLRLENGSCTRSCPRGFKELENFICKRRCPFAIPFVLNGKCYKECPAGYTRNPKRATCEKCPEDNCPRTCRPEKFKRGINILSLSDSAKLKGCTIYSGNVAIEMQNVRGGTNIAQVLTDHLGSLEEIRGHVVVRQSTPLISLNFFKNLRKITLRDNFSGFSSKGYALAIFDNPNLESLWEFHPNFKINNRNPKTINGMFVQLNPRLCLKNIYPLVEDVLKWNKSDPNVDISETTNGNARNCDVNFVNLTITGRQKCFKPGLCVKVSWPNKVEDYRNLILYSVWYRETTSTDLNEYDDIDACNSDHVWERQDVSSKRRAIISGTVYGLKAHTLYAFRVNAIVIGGTGVKSYITYFKTRQTKPSVPRSHEVSYLSSSSLQVKWREPFFPNGEITHYLVKYKEISSSYLWDLNVKSCQNIDSSIDFYKKKKVKDKLTSGNQTCPVNLTCNCDNEKDEKQSLDLKEALFAKEFQDKILQEVFKKNDTNNNKITTTPRPCGNYSKNSSCSTQRPNTQELSTSISTTPTSVLSTTTAPLVILNTTQQTIILEGLKYFTEYSVEVCACNSGAGCGENRGYVTQCSTVLGRTGKSDTADDVGDTLEFDAYNDSKQFTLEWKAPDRPNGKVLRYDVWIQYKPIKGNETVDDQQCVTVAQYTKIGASFGDYTARVRAITPVGNGSWSNQVNFRIDEKITPPGIEAQKEDANFVTVVGVSVGAILFALVVFVVLTFSLIKRHKKSKHGAGVLFSSTNPEYWNCSDVYVPDEWEVPRGDVTLIRELGNGSFGMVWEGEAVGILPGVHSCKVAVKTVSDTSSIRDKVEFLKEASIMKAFNCNHVLRLLGVVSAGDPVLVIMELMENGDLKSFLRKRRPDSEEDCSLPPPTNVELFQMAAEIADGMAYLADRKFVHRDLAARNCMVSGNHTCKIGDFGLARDVYETDYYRKGTKGFLPVRWMSPESLRDGVFCSASDVWSYGVVLWEMATLAEQPYQGKSNEEVMKFVLGGNIMDIPESYPRKLLEIMLLCWQQKPGNRPTFLSIVENLEGYLTLDFTERSFYHNGRPRKETDSSSLVSLGTENDNLSELPDFLADHAPKSPIPRESFV